jgi:AcrR family transcriptional regulator
MPTADRRAQIRTAAARLFATRGFHGVSIEDIGAACGISGPAVYRHFASKDALLTALLVDISEYLLAGAQAEVVASDPPQEVLRRLIRFHIAFSLDNPDLIRVQDRDLANLEERGRRVRRLQRAYVGVWAGVLAQVGGVTDAEATARAHAIFGLLNSTPHFADGRARSELDALLAGMAAAAAVAAPA